MAKIAFYAYYFPPQISAGSQRPARMVKMMQELGHDVTVFTNKPHQDQVDQSQFPLGHVHNHIVELMDPADALLRYVPNILKKIINFVAVPDVKIFHAMRVYNKIKQSDFDIIVTTSAPLSSHIVGVLLARRLVWISDIRDSIINNPSVQLKRIKPLEYFAGKILNKLIDRNSKLKLTASKTISEDYTNNKIVFYNGFYDENKWRRGSISKKHFIIGYVGSLYAERDPDIFRCGFTQFAQSLSHDDTKKIKLQFIGNNHNKTQKKLEKFPHSIDLEVFPYIEKQKLFDIANSWSILLLLVDDVPYSRGVITGKLFDYLCMNGRVLAIAPDDSEISEILIRTNKGRVVPKNAVDDISHYLLDLFEKWKCDELSKMQSNHAEINMYSYAEQKKHLENIINNLDLYEL